jgi:hypothetical protein
LQRLVGCGVSAYLWRVEIPMHHLTAFRLAREPAVWAGAATLALLGGTIWLWALYGTVVFFETIRTGFIACFG